MSEGGGGIYVVHVLTKRLYVNHGRSDQNRKRRAYRRGLRLTQCTGRAVLDFADRPSERLPVRVVLVRPPSYVRRACSTKPATPGRPDPARPGRAPGPGHTSPSPGAPRSPAPAVVRLLIDLRATDTARSSACGEEVGLAARTL